MYIKNKNKLVFVVIMLLQVFLSCASSSSTQKAGKAKKITAIKKTLSRPVSIYNHEMLPLDKTIPTLSSMLMPLVADQFIKKIEQAIKKNEQLTIKDFYSKKLLPLPVDGVVALEPLPVNRVVILVPLPEEVLSPVKAALDTYRSGSDPLIVKAVVAKNKSVVKCLFQLNVDLNVTNKTQYNGLMIASQNGDLDMVELLIAARADVVCNRDAYAPILLATKNGHAEIVKVLYRNGADVNGRKHHYQTEAYYKKGLICHTNIPSTAKNSPVFNAFKYNHVEIAMDLIEKAGANFDVRDNNADTPLIWAERYEKRETISKLNALYLKKSNDENAKRKNTESIVIDDENNHIDPVAKKARIEDLV